MVITLFKNDTKGLALEKKEEYLDQCAKKLFLQWPFY